MNITIIGSFRKYYDDICSVIQMFEENGIRVLSPKLSVIVDDLDGFVILKSDNRSYKPYEIQQKVFDNIDKSDYVYVWNPGGYVGLTTAYEIGRVTEKGLRIFYKERVKDLPIFISEDNIKNPDELIDYLNSRHLLMMA
ncbi:MAG: hypothetical protein GX757_00595 [Clostridiales bacterium]|nr:hypothetical protein [Clostridiales bacterium]